jgi:hypothetical protein
MTRVDPYLKVFNDLGIEIVSTARTGSCHYKITATYKDHRKFFIAASSVSDHRAIQNFRSEVKRWKRSTEQEETLR